MRIINQIGQEVNISGKVETDFELYVKAQDESEQDIDFTNYSGKMEIRGSYKSKIVSEFDVTLESGLITISKDAADMNFNPGKYVYDLKLTYPSGKVFRWLYGQFIMLERSTT